MKESNINKEREELWMKSIIESARKEPPENLLYRIMHQIETEKALSPTKPKTIKQRENSLIDFRNIFGLMYLVLLLVGGYFYLQGGREALLTESFLWRGVTISSIFSLYFLIITIDNFRQKTKRERSSSSE
mgnify:CR=1 FL=1